MSEFRWLLFAVGVLILLLVFWLSRRESSGRPPVDAGDLLRRRLSRVPLPAVENRAENGTGSQAESTPVSSAQQGQQPERIIAVRLTGRGSGSFSGEALVLALRNAGLRHGRFGIFHRHAPEDDAKVLFSVASLVEPGSFDLTRLKTERFPGVSLFLALPGPIDGLAAFDDMLSIAHALATALDGELLDEQGSRLSIQRERFLREEVIQFQHKIAPP